MSKDILQCLSNDWGQLKEVILFGWGKYGQKLIKDIEKDFEVKCIIENDPHKNNQTYHDIPIISLTDAQKYISDYKIIVMTHKDAFRSIKNQLEKIGLIHYRDFCELEHFVVEWYWRWRNEINIFELHTSITTRCTLKCKKCNMFMTYHKEPKDLEFEQICLEIDMLFSKINYVYNYELLGGEPFLHKDLAKIILYMKQNYRDKVGKIGLITNGTLLPSSELLEICKNENVDITISDYTNTVPYEKRLSEVVALLEQYKINYKVLKNNKWLDFGFPEHPCHIQNVREHMLTCRPVFHGYNDFKLYYCHVAWSAEKCGLIHLDSEDYVDLNECDDSDKKRKRLAKYSLGEWNRGFVSMCRVCGGCGKDNNQSIEAGIQRGN